MRTRSTRSVAAAPFALALSLVLLFAAASPAGARDGRIGGRSPAAPTDHNVNISKMHANQTEESVAINKTNPNNIVAISNLDTANGLFKAFSTDGGKTWTTDVIADGDGLGTACCDGSLSFDQYGNLFMAYLNANNGNVPIALSTDGGATFTLIATIHPSAPGPLSGPTKGRSLSPLASADQPTITTGANSVWVTWTSTKIQASGAAVTGLGQVGTFSTPQNAGGTNSFGDYGDVAIGPNGQVMVIYQNPTGGQGPANIYTDLDPDGLGPLGFRAAVLFATTSVGGFDFIPAQSTRSIDAESALMWDRTTGTHAGRLYAMWTQETPDESNNTDIMFQYSDTGGSTWTPPVKLNDDSGTNSQFNPKLAIDQKTGKLAACWYDARNDLGTGGSGDTNGIPNDDAQHWCTYSTDGGATFVPNFQVSKGTSNAKDANNGIDYGDYGALDFSASRFSPVWSDNSNSTGDNPDGTLKRFDLYTVRIRVR